MKKIKLIPEKGKYVISNKSYDLHVRTNLFYLHGFWIETNVILKNISDTDTLKWNPKLFKLSIHRKENEDYKIYNKIYKNQGNIILPGKIKKYIILSNFEDLKLFNNHKLLDETKYIIELDTIFCGKTKVLPKPITFRAK